MKVYLVGMYEEAYTKMHGIENLKKEYWSICSTWNNFHTTSFCVGTRWINIIEIPQILDMEHSVGMNDMHNPFIVH
jgi:hypothetical protein